jgi:hypothetical protein
MYDYIFFTDVTDTVLSQKAIGAYKVASALREHNYKCLVVDHLHTWTVDDLKTVIDKSVNSNTKAIGISTTFLMNSNVENTSNSSLHYNILSADQSIFPQGKDFENEILLYIKQKNSAVKIIAGGTKTHLNLSNKNVDYAVIGYAETAILNIDKHLTFGTPIPNSSKNIWGVIVVKTQQDNEYNFVDSTIHWEKTDIVNAQVLPFEIARGCIFKCKFCSYPLNGKKNLDFVRDSKRLQHELQDNYDRFGIHDYWILDDTFNDNEYKLNLLLNAIQSLNFLPSFWAYTRLDLLTTKQHIKKLYDIGLRSVYFGIETLNPETGRLIGKGYNRERQIETIQEIRNHYPDVSMHGSFIIGLPNESTESVTDTFEKCMNQTIPLHSWTFKELRLSKPDKVPWSSDLDLNYSKYGYTQLPTPDNSVTINWQNQYMNNSEALGLANQFRDQSNSNIHMNVTGQTAWALKNYGYPQDYLLNLPFSKVNWYQITQDKKKFIKDYKQQFLSII